MKRTVFSLGLTALLASTSAWALKVPTSSTDFDFNINVLLQARNEDTFEGSQNKQMDVDFFLRRARLQASGTAYKTLSFAIQFDNSNQGKRGTPTSVNTNTTPAFVQDLIVGWTPIPDFTIEGGLILEPSLRTMAYSASGGQVRIEAPTDTIMDNLSRGFRENGVELRGFLIGHIIHYRLGLWEGFHSQGVVAANATTGVTAAPAINPQGKPLVGGHVRLNLIGDETGYSFNQMYMDGKARVSVGAALQHQANAACYGAALGAGFFGYNNVCSISSGAAGTGVVNDYNMYGFDAFVDLPLPGNDVEFSADGSATRWDYGENKPTGSTNVGFQKTGWGYTASGNLRFGPIAFYVDWYRFLADSGTTNKSFDRRKIAGGIAFFIRGHADKVTLEFNNISPSGNTAGAVSNPTASAPLGNAAQGITGPSINAIWVQAQAAF
jgi:Phosphate-selective porin O and P